MASISHTLVFVAFWISLFAVVISAPAPVLEDIGKGLSVPVTHNVNKTRNGPLEMYKAFRKFNIDIPEPLQRIVHKQQANKAALADGKLYTLLLERED